MSLNLAITLIMLFVLLYAEQCPGDVTQQTLQICNMGDAELAWSLSEGSVSLPDVLLLHADDDSTYGSPIQGILQAYGDLGAVDLYDARSDTPTLAQLLAYDVVLTWSRDYYHDQVAIGDVLADYVDAGGKVINLNYSMGPPAQQMEGRFMDEGYTAMDGGLVYFGSTCLGTYNPDDPIMAGVTQVCDSVPLADTYLTPGSHAVAWWAGGDLLFVAAKDNQTVVSIAGYVGYVYSWTGQMPDVVHNAVLWLTANLPEAPWLSEDPLSGTVPAGQCAEVIVTFDSTGLVPGDYSGSLVITSNDPDEREFAMQVELTVLTPVSISLATWTPLGLQVTFEAEASGSAPMTFAWDFGDGGTATGQSVSHAYAAPGNYSVTLAVDNRCGQATTEHTVTVHREYYYYLPIISLNQTP